MRGLGPRASTRKRGGLGIALHRHIDGPADRDRGERDDNEVHQQLNAVLFDIEPRRLPVEADLLILHELRRELLRVTEIDGASRGAGGTKGNPRELQPRRGLTGALADQIQGKRSCFRAVIFVEEFEAVHDRADGANSVMADPAACSAARSRALSSDRLERIGHENLH